MTVRPDIAAPNTAAAQRGAIPPGSSPLPPVTTAGRDLAAIAAERSAAADAAAPSGIWRQSLRGRVIEMVFPTAAQVDFGEIANELAGIYRWCGACQLDVSVGLHTVAGCDAVEPELVPWWLLHDAHETRIGDITTPAAEALAAVAEGGHAVAVVSEAIRTLKRRHDLAIHQAAGLPLPDEAQKRALRRADLVMLVTERRDFMRPAPMGWAVDAMAVEPLRRRMRWSPKPDVADDLVRLFNQHLPACKARPATAW